MRLSTTIPVLVLLSVFTSVNAQKQLLLLKNGRVMQRFNAGDGIYVSLKGSTDRIHSYVNNILDDAIVLHQDTIPLHKIDRTYIYESKKMNSGGTKLVAAGVLLFLIDVVNQSLVQKNDYEVDRGVSIVSISLVTAGLPMMLIKKKSQKLAYKYRLMIVKEGDPMYRF